MSSCSRHPSKESVGACINCGKLVCVQCRVEHDDKTYCQPCAEKLFVVKEIPPEPKPVSTPSEAKPVVTPSEPKPVLTAATAATPVADKKELPQTTVEIMQAAAPDIKAAPEPVLPTILGVNILWYVAVLLFGWIGGLAAWWKNKKQAPQASRYLLFGGIGWSAVQTVLAVILVAALIITPALKAGFKWPAKSSKPPVVSQGTPAEEEQASEPAASIRHYTPPKVKRSETGTIITDTPVELATASIDTSGGAVTVDKPGDPLNGLQITVPPAAYKDAKSFKVSSAPITVNTFGNGVDPISPMIIVENGGEAAGSAMTLKVPVKLAVGQAAIWYFYDEKTGTLVPAPALPADNDSISVNTTHFSKGFVSRVSNFYNKGEIDSGFRPGTDSWQFPNYGSWISRGGICNGMSLTAMWYYLNRPDGDKTLFGTYDNGGEPNPPTPDFWQDDALAYRFCSVVHDDLSVRSPILFNPGTTENISANAFWSGAKDYASDNYTRGLFESAMLSTGEPQMVWIYTDPYTDSEGNTNTIDAHALVVYKIVNGTLYISDPNVKGETSTIQWDGVQSKYKPYMGSSTQGGVTEPYTHIVYAAKGTLIPWSTVNEYWAQLKNQTIGNDRFPAYKVNVVDKDGKKTELTDDYEITDGKIKIELDTMGNPDLSFNLYKTTPLYQSITGVYKNPSGEFEPGADGDLLLGVEVMVPNPPKHDIFVDFKWYKVKSGGGTPELKIESPAQPGYVGEQYTFKALVKDLPKDAQLEWFIKDNPDDTGKRYGDVDTVAHTFDSAGDKTILLHAIKNGKVIKLSGGEKNDVEDVSTIFKVVQPPIEILANPNTGAVGQSSVFSIKDASFLPDDAKYSWSFGNGKKDDEVKGSTTFDEAKTYTVSVTVTWAKGVKSPGAIEINRAEQEHAFGEIKYVVTGDLQPSIVADPPVGIKNEKTTFSVKGDKITEGVAFYWEFGDDNQNGNMSSLAKDGKAEHTYTREDTFDVKVTMMETKNPKPLTPQPELHYVVAPPATLAIVAPAEIKQGKGVTNTEFIFKSTWEPGKAPNGVTYSWISNGPASGDKADCPITFTAEGPYNLKVKATWKDSGGAPREAESQPIDFNIGAKTAFAIVSTDGHLQKSGNGAIDQQYTFTADWNPKTAPAGVNYAWLVDTEGVEDQGGSIPYTFKTEGKHTVSATASWKDDKNTDKSSNSNRSFMMSAQTSTVSLTCTDAGIQNDKIGVTKKDYFFNVSWPSGKAPADVKYAWILNDESTDKVGAKEGFNFKDENDYTIKVTASWITSSKETKTTDATLSFKIEKATNFSVRCADSALQSSRKGVPGKEYKFYAYWGEGGSAPEGTTYSWSLNDDDTGDTGETISMPLSADPSGASKSYTVKVTAKWTDKSGTARSPSADIKFDIGSEPTLSIKVPEEIDSGKGVTKKPYSFSADPHNIPAGADYNWYSGGVVKKHGKDLKSVTNTFTTATNYALKVEAKWTDAGGKAQSVTSPEVEFDIAAAATITLNAPAEVKANKGIKGQKYQFSVTTTDIPAGAEYTWYSNDEEKTSGKDKKTGNISFGEATDYTLKVEARWTDSGKEQFATSPAISFHINAGATLSIIPPGSLSAGKGLPEKGYTFSAKPQGIPDDAEYTWSVNDKSLGKSSEDKSPLVKTDKDPKDYTVKVVATWKANNQSQHVEGTFKFTTNTGIVLTEGKFIDSSGCHPEGFNQLGMVFLQPTFAKVTINIVGDKATADQTVPVTIDTDKGSASGSFKVKIDGTIAGNKFSGPFTVDGSVTFVDKEGKSMPIDFKYSGHVTSNPIPAAPKGEIVNCTFTGPVKSQAIYQLIVSLGDMAGEMAAGCASVGTGGTGNTVSKQPQDNTMPTSEVLCTDYVSNVQFTASASDK